MESKPLSPSKQEARLTGLLTASDLVCGGILDKAVRATIFGAEVIREKVLKSMFLANSNGRNHWAFL